MEGQNEDKQNQFDKSGDNSLRTKVTHFVESSKFNVSITWIIIINAIVICIMTQLQATGMRESLIYNIAFVLDAACLAIYVVEMVLKLIAWRFSYFKDPWNIFDFAIIVVSFLPYFGVSAQIARIFRIFRVLRTLRLISNIESLRRILTGLVKSIPGIASTMGLLAIIYIVYGVIGVELYGEVEPKCFGDLPAAFFTMFQLTTTEGWVDVARTAMETDGFAWIYFISFVVICSFIILNIILGIIVDALETGDEEEEARDDRNFTRLDGQMKDLQAQLAAINAQLEALNEKKK